MLGLKRPFWPTDMIPSFSFPLGKKLCRCKQQCWVPTWGKSWGMGTRRGTWKAEAEGGAGSRVGPCAVLLFQSPFTTFSPPPFGVLGHRGTAFCLPMAFLAVP